eukprot:scaffold108628_cov63-Phaeocystis_antarctica.AAC.1
MRSSSTSRRSRLTASARWQSSWFKVPPALCDVTAPRVQRLPPLQHPPRGHTTQPPTCGSPAAHERAQGSAEGEQVSYDTVEDGGKAKATNVCAPGGGPVQGDAGGKGKGGGGGRNSQAPRKWPDGEAPSEGKSIGSVKWFNVEKGFGFIAPQSGGEDLFVHQSAIHSQGFRSLMEGEEVEFNMIEEGGKYKAVDVTGPAGDFVQGAPRSGGGGRGG